VPPDKKYRQVIFYKDYFEKFFVLQNEKIRAKIIWTLELIEDIERIPKTYLKHIATSDGLYEIRVKHGRTLLRIFCFFDMNRLVILANAFQKKTERTPGEQIELVKRIKKEYEEERKTY
jgi:phage-related protein